jgi:pimeloyl-ACP methyl ester carboxylesterase
MGWLVLDCWRSVETLRGVRVPVLVVHGACDRLFPVAMGAELAVAAGTRGELAVIPGMGHPDLHSRARPEDWKVILERIVD